MQKGGHFDIFDCPPRTCPPKRGRVVALLNNATRMHPRQI